MFLLVYLYTIVKFLLGVGIYGFIFFILLLSIDLSVDALLAYLEGRKAVTLVQWTFGLFVGLHSPEVLVRFPFHGAISVLLLVSFVLACPQEKAAFLRLVLCIP